MSGPSMAGVAQAAGVGIGTVSRVINNSPLVRPETAAAVRQVMAQLGYRPPAPNRRRGPKVGQRRRPTAAGGVVLLIIGAQGLRWVLDCAPVYATVLSGIEAALAQRGQQLAVRQAQNWDQVAEIVAASRTKGLIILGQDDPPGPMPPAVRRIPKVWVMGSPRHGEMDHVQPDHLTVGVMAGEYLVGRGHRRCAYLGVDDGSPARHVGFRCRGFCGVVQGAGGSVQVLLDPALVSVSRGVNAPDEAILGRLMDQFAALPHRPTALMVEADLLAPSVYRHLTQRGIRPQQDVEIVTCNNERPYLLSLQPAPVVVDLQAEAIGRRAVDQLLWRLLHPREPRMRLMVEPLLVKPDEAVPGS